MKNNSTTTSLLPSHGDEDGDDITATEPSASASVLDAATSTAIQLHDLPVKNGKDSKNDTALDVDANDANCRNNEKENESESEDENDGENDKSSKNKGVTRVMVTVQKYAPVILKFVALIAFTVYFAFSMMCNFGNTIGTKMIILAAIIYLKVALKILPQLLCYRNCIARLSVCDFYCCKMTEKMQKITKIVFICFVFAALAAVIILCAVRSPYNLVSFAGIFVLVGLCYLISKYRKQVRWYPVIAGITVQLVMGVLALNFMVVYTALVWLGDEINGLIDFYKEGAKYLCGDSYQDHWIIFGISCLILFFSGVLGILNYFGIIQSITFGIATVLEKILRTNPAESVVAAANIFLGGLTSCMMIKPVLNDVTVAELYSMFVSSLGTVAGPAMGIYSQYGIPMHHLIIASFLSAPAALAISRLLHPATKITPVTTKTLKSLPTKNNANVVDALQCGAAAGIEIVVAVMVNLSVFISMLHLINAILTWFGRAVCIEQEITFQFLCSYLLWPLAFILGARIADCQKVAEILGVKIFLSEYLAYIQLGNLMENTKVYHGYNGTIQMSGNDIILVDRNTTLTGGILHDYRSFVVATYALCGFSSIGSVGIVMGGMSALASKRTTDITKMAFHAWMASNIACFLTACIAGSLYDPAASMIPSP